MVRLHGNRKVPGGGGGGGMALTHEAFVSMTSVMWRQFLRLVPWPRLLCPVLPLEHHYGLLIMITLSDGYHIALFTTVLVLVCVNT